MFVSTEVCKNKKPLKTENKSVKAAVAVNDNTQTDWIVTGRLGSKCWQIIVLTLKPFLKHKFNKNRWFEQFCRDRIALQLPLVLFDLFYIYICNLETVFFILRTHNIHGQYQYMSILANSNDLLSTYLYLFGIKN